MAKVGRTPTKPEKPRRSPTKPSRSDRSASSADTLPPPATDANAQIEGVAAARVPARLGKNHIGGYFSPEWKRSMLLIQLKTGKKFQNQMEEALIDLFRKHDVPVPSTE